jgi:hypothetical protein
MYRKEYAQKALLFGTHFPFYNISNPCPIHVLQASCASF